MFFITTIVTAYNCQKLPIYGNIFPKVMFKLHSLLRCCQIQYHINGDYIVMTLKISSYTV